MPEKSVLIVGGGISGMTVALELNRMGIPALLIEREPALGGLSASFCCKASESCNKCFACVVDKRISEIGQSRGLSILTQTELMDVKKETGGFRFSLKERKREINLTTSAVVLATGVSPYDATEKAEYGYGRFKNVVTAKDLDEMLRYRGKLSRPSDDKLPGTVAFFQCVGSRDESIGRLYCSQVCCAYALRLIKAIRHQHPEVKATFLYMDIQPAGVSFQQLLNSSRQDANLRLIRSLPSKVYYSPFSDQLRVRFADPEKGEVVEESFDLIVLSVGMVLRPDTKHLSDFFGLQFTEDGFIAPRGSSEGVFFAGACTGPKDIDRSILHAKSIAYRVWQFMEGRS